MRLTMRANLIGVFALTVFLSAATLPESPIADAAMRRDLPAVQALIKKKAAVNAPQGDGMTALHWAAKHGETEMVALLLRNKANLKAVTRIGAYTPLHIASEAGNGAVVLALLKAGADAKATTTTGVVPLHLAAAAGNTVSIKALLDHGADVNVKEPSWEHTPLII